MLDITLDGVHITGSKLTRAWNQICTPKPKASNEYIKGGIKYMPLVNPYTHNYGRARLCVNDSYIFTKYIHGWDYTDTTADYKCKHIPPHEDEHYSIICDKGSFIINDIAFQNGFGDGQFPCVVRTCEHKSDYYTKKSVYENNVIILRPENGRCKIMMYDCNPETYKEFTDVEEIQIAAGKMYIVKINKNVNKEV